MLTSNEYFGGEPLRIGDRWQHLLDDTLVEDRFRLRRELRPPRKYPHNPVVTRDRPWEGDKVARGWVLWDGAWGRYRMWYQCFSRSRYHGAPGSPYFLCYAESDDGIHWEKPLLDVVDTPGFERTNIVYNGTFYPRVQGPQVWRDEAETDESRRYKMVCVEGRPDRNGALRSGVQMAYSPDGLQWRLDPEERPLLDYHSDTHNHVVRSPDDESWLLYCRPNLLHAGEPARRRETMPEGMTAPRHSGRRTSVAASDDMKQWSFPRTVLHPDERDAPDIDQMNVFPAGGSLVMLYAAMDGDTTGCNEIKLASSGDGFHWHRFHTREPYIARGGPDAWDCGSVRPSCAPIQQDDRLLIYYMADTAGQHEPGEGLGGVGVAVTKKGRFVEQVADDAPGFLLTREFVLEGAELRVNTPSVGAPNRISELRVEILSHPPASDVVGHAVVQEGFSREDCDPITGDHTDKLVTWNGSGDLSLLLGKPVYLRFMLRNRGLCAFRIAG